MKLGMSTMCIDSHPIREKIQAVADAKFDCIEMWWKDFHHNPREVRKMVEDHGLEVSSVSKIEGWFELNGGLIGVSNDEEAIFGKIRRMMEDSKELGSKHVIVLPSRSDYEQRATMEEGAERFCKLAEIADDVGIIPTLEFIGQSEQVKNIATTLEFMKLVGRPMKIVVDVFHIWRGGSDLSEMKNLPAECIEILHLHDVSKQYDRYEYRDRHRIMPGDGILDLVEFLEIAREKGFDGNVVLGVYNPELWKRCPFEVAEEGYEKMKRVMEQ